METSCSNHTPAAASLCATLRRLAPSICWLLLICSANGQGSQRRPQVGYVYPAGGQQGATFEAFVGGQYLKGSHKVFVSGEGVTAAVIGHQPPLSNKRVNEMREQLKEVRIQMAQARKQGKFKSPEQALKTFLKHAAGKGITEDDLRRAADYRLRRSDPKRQLDPQIAEMVSIRVTVAPDAEPGIRDLRLRTQIGLTNPLRFCIGQLPEVREKGTGRTITWEQIAKMNYGTYQATKPEDNTTQLKLPTIVNGQILPGEVDRFRFRAQAGQRLVAAVSARQLIPYLADAVPGWFQATVALFDAKGEEVAYADDFRFHPDPVICYDIPAAGNYTLEIKDSIYRGREDFVYRIMLGEQPFITGVFPLGTRVRQPAEVEVEGWNLPKTKLTLPPESACGQAQVNITWHGKTSNSVPFSVGALDEVIEIEPNNTLAEAQSIPAPLVINGRISEHNDGDIFRFQGNKDDVVVAEVFARRLGSPLDSVLKLTDSAGAEIAANDDSEDKGAGLTTHHADSRLQAVLPGGGEYFLHLSDTQRRSGPAYSYRLRVAPPAPDFELRVVPSSLSLRAGATVPLKIHVLRRDGFDGDIELALKDPPPGVRLTNANLPAGEDQYEIGLTAGYQLAGRTISLAFEGSAEVNGRKLVHPAEPADDLMQAFIYRHLVPAQEMKVTVGPATRRFQPGRFGKARKKKNKT